VIVTGCAHPGVVNIIRKAREIVPDREMYLVMGGFHLAGEVHNSGYHCPVPAVSCAKCNPVPLQRR